MDGDSNDLPDEDAMRSARDLLLKTTIEVRETARQFRRASCQCSPFAVREALGTRAAFHPRKALGDPDLRMAEYVNAEIAPLENPGVPLPPPVDAYEHLRLLDGYRAYGPVAVSPAQCCASIPVVTKVTAADS